MSRLYGPRNASVARKLMEWVGRLAITVEEDVEDSELDLREDLKSEFTGIVRLGTRTS